MNAATPTMPVSTPISVYVDSPALMSTPVRDALTPAFPRPYPWGCRTTVRTPSRRLRQWLVVEASPPASGSVAAPGFSGLPAQKLELRLGVARRGADVGERLHEPDARRRASDREAEGQERGAARTRAPRARARERGTRPACASEQPHVRPRSPRPRPTTGRRRATRYRRTMTRTYAVASGLRKVEPRRRIGFSSSPVFRTQFSGSPERPRCSPARAAPRTSRERRIAPPLERYQVDVCKAPCGHRRGDPDERQRDAAPRRRREHEQASEEVRGDRDQVMARSEKLALLGSVAVPPALGNEPVEKTRAA